MKPSNVGIFNNNNYDMENRKLTNVQNGDDDRDVMVRSQIEGFVQDKKKYLDGSLPAQVLKNKAVIYSPSGCVHADALYLKDQRGQEVHFFTENQDDNQIRLYIPNLKNNDSYGGRHKSSVVVTSIDQTVEGKKVFKNIEVPAAVKDTQAVNKKYVDDELSGLVKKSGDAMTGPLIYQQIHIQFREISTKSSVMKHRGISSCRKKKEDKCLNQ